nr:unnamed protein product [Callosobruchus analis]
MAEVMENILQKAHHWINFPSTSDEIREVQHLWQQVYTSSAAIGVLDCTHVRISKPPQFGGEYINRKGLLASMYKRRAMHRKKIQV